MPLIPIYRVFHFPCVSLLMITLAPRGQRFMSVLFMAESQMAILLPCQQVASLVPLWQLAPGKRAPTLPLTAQDNPSPPALGSENRYWPLRAQGTQQVLSTCLLSERGEPPSSSQVQGAAPLLTSTRLRHADPRRAVSLVQKLSSGFLGFCRHTWVLPALVPSGCTLELRGSQHPTCWAPTELGHP